MRESFNVSGDFVSLVNELQSSPGNPALQQKLAQRIPEIKLLAKDNPLLLFHLAKIYSPTSPEYKNAIRQSANQGCTNAMLALCQLLVKSEHQADLKTAAHFMRKIKDSKDSHIISLSQTLLSEHPRLAAELKENTRQQVPSFFKPCAMPVRPQEIEATNGLGL